MWLRIVLIGILIYLVVSMIGRYLSGGKKDREDDTKIKNSRKKKGFPGDVGEYVDYEEVDDDD